tara:strand:+ start:882 stop:1649 length:768 start_codon:yes stop_codon:yes gene_type:complete
MALSDYPTVNGILQTDSAGSSTIVINPGGAWTDLPATWDTWLNYNIGGGDTLYWITEPIIMERPDYFNIETDIDATGIVEYTVWTSVTGAFAGEETQTVINENDTDIDAFNGTYVVLGIKVTEVSANGPVQINRFSWETTGRTLSYYFNDFNSSQLEGTVSARQVYVPRVSSWITNVQITPQLASNRYVAADYVVDDYFESTTAGYVIPQIVAKYSDRFDIRFYTSSGSETDAVFDAVATVLPEQYANGANLSAR